MAEELQQLLLRAQRRIEILEAMVEDRAREVFLVNERLQAASLALRKVYHSLPAALLVLDADGTIQLANDAALELLEQDEDTLIGAPLTRAFEPDSAFDAARLDVLVESGGVLRAEQMCRTRSGRRVPVLLAARAFADAQGGSPHVVCVAFDLRERKQLELELRQAQKLESVGRLAAGIAHELNTPIQFVGDSIHFVREAMEDLSGPLEHMLAAEHGAAEHDVPYLLENIPKALDRAMEGVSRVATIVRSMREFAHPDQKQMTAVDLNRAVTSTLAIARNEIKYVADVDTDLGELPAVVCHGGDVNQAILNVVVNAAHAIGEVVRERGGRGRISVRTRREGDDAVIEISDTGPGIPEELRERIFDPFFTTKEVGHGTGQGLAIARAVIVDQHGGSLRFESRPGEGTTFFLRLPLHGARKPAVPVP